LGRPTGRGRGSSIGTLTRSSDTLTEVASPGTSTASIKTGCFGLAIAVVVGESVLQSAVRRTPPISGLDYAARADGGWGSAAFQCRVADPGPGSVDGVGRRDPRAPFAAGGQ